MIMSGLIYYIVRTVVDVLAIIGLITVIKWIVTYNARKNKK